MQTSNSGQALGALSAALLSLSTLACASGDSIETGPGSGGSGQVTTGTGGSDGGASSGTESTSTGLTSGSTTTSTTTGSGTPCEESPCKLVAPQCGCESTQKCTLSPNNNPECVPNGTQAVGQQCGQSNTDCAAGGLCLNMIGSDAQAACYAFCASNGDCQAPGGECIELTSGGASIGASVCTENCVPSGMPNTGCPISGTKCALYIDEGDVTRSQCLAVGGGGAGSSCSNDTDCQINQACVSFNMGANQCQPWCTANSGCDSNNCIQFDPPLTIGGTSYGVCAPS